MVTIFFCCFLITYFVVEASCEAPWKELQSKCYLLIDEGDDQNYANSLEVCEGKDAKLVSIGSEEEFDLITETFPSFEFWLGAKKVKIRAFR